MVVGRRRIVVVAFPSTIEAYSLDHIYIKNEVRYIMNLPLHNHIIIPSMDLEFSDHTDLVYVGATDNARGATSVLIYRTDRPAALSLHAIIQLPDRYSRPTLEIEASGTTVDYLSIKTPLGFSLYKVFEQPQLVI
jgi:hypothetical protein